MGKRVTRDKSANTTTTTTTPHSTAPQEIEITTTTSNNKDTLIVNGSRRKKSETTTLNYEINVAQPKQSDENGAVVEAHPKQCECDESERRTPSAKTSFLPPSAANDEEEEKGREEKRAEDSSAMSSHSGLPVDRGWAWVIMTMQFTLTFLMVGYGRSLSIFFMEFLQMFDVAVTSATIVIGLMTAAFGLGNLLVSHVLLSRFSVRTMVLTGSLMNAAGIALTSLAPNMIYVAVMHCFIGFSHSLVFVPGTTLVGHYFHRRRSTALAVANTGLSVSALVFPPLTEVLITHFGTRGALLLVAGIELQSVVAASLMRPVSWYTTTTSKKRPTGAAEKDREARGSDCVIKDPEMKASKKSTRYQNVNELKRTLGGSNRGMGEKDRGGDDEEDTTTRLLEEFQHRETRTDTHHLPPPAYNRLLSAGSPLSSSLPDSFLSKQSQVGCSSEEVGVNLGHKRTYARELSCPAAAHHHHLTVRQDSQMSDSRKRVSALATSMVDICGSAVNIAPDAVFLPASNDQREDGEDVCTVGDKMRAKRGGFWNRCASVMSKIIDVSLFKNWLFLLILTYVPLGFSGGFIAFYFPSLGVEKGLTRSDAALLMTVAGGVDLVSRLCVGYLADLGLLKRTHLVAGCMIVIGLACHFCRFYSGFGLLAGFAVVYGLVGGVCNNLFAVVIIDLLGLPLLGKVMGLVMLFNSVFTAVNHVLIGALVDTTGSFIIPYNYVGASLFLSSLILMMEPLARRLEAKRLRKLEANVDIGREPVDA